MKKEKLTRRVERCYYCQEWAVNMVDNKEPEEEEEEEPEEEEEEEKTRLYLCKCCGCLMVLTIPPED